MLNNNKNLYISPLFSLLLTTTSLVLVPTIAKGATESHSPQSTSRAIFPFKSIPVNFDPISTNKFPQKANFFSPNLLLAQETTPTPETVPAPTSETPTPETVPVPTGETPTPEAVPTPAIETPTPGAVPVPTGETPTPEAVPVPTGETPTPEAVPAPAIDTPIPTEQPSQQLPSFDSSPTTTPPNESAQPDTTTEARVLVSEVVVSGATPELEKLVYNTVSTKPGRTATRSQLQEDVNAIYATGYFGNVKVSPEDTPLGVRVTFAVQPNPVLQSVVIETVPATDKAKVLPDDILTTTFSEQYGKILNLRDLQEGIKKINEWYSTNGYDLAQVVGAPKVGEDGKVTLVISEGVVENIQVRFFNAEDEPATGRTREFIVTREMQLKPGDVFNRNTAQRDLQRIYGLGLFEDARFSFNPGTDPREVIVNVDVVEGNTGSIAAGGGVSSTSGLFATLSYQEKNLGGNAQTFGTELQVGQRELLFDVNFTDPWIAGDPYRTAYTVNGFRRRTISLVYDGNDSSIRTLDNLDSPRVVRTGLGVTFFRPLAPDIFTAPDWRLSAGFSYQHVELTDGDGDIAPLSAPLNGYGSQNLAFSPSGIDDLWIFSVGASQDTRNSPLQPTSGSVIRFGMEQTAPVGSGSILFNRLRGSYSYYLPVNWLDLTGFGFTESTQPQALAFNLQAGTVLGDLPPYEAFIIGGSNSVRGYAEGDVGSGRSYVQATAEYRFPIISAVGGALFFDYGSTLGSDDAVPGIPSVIRGLPGQGYGYGIGVRIQSPVGPIRIDYGINEQGGSRVNFGIGEKF